MHISLLSQGILSLEAVSLVVNQLIQTIEESHYFQYCNYMQYYMTVASNIYLYQWVF